MGCCHQCDGIEQLFGERVARRDLRRFRRKGPIASTRLLIEQLRDAGVEGASLLDVGGGIGAVQHELLDAGVRVAVHVDASSHYLQASREEAARRGREDLVTYVHGDFVDLAAEMPEADVVTLDRVICCYPDMQRLVEASASRARRLYGVVFPRDRAAVRIGIPIANLLSRLQRIPFRVYLHPPEAIDAAIRGQGLKRRSHRRTLLWNVVVYAREPAA